MQILRDAEVVEMCCQDQVDDNILRNLKRSERKWNGTGRNSRKGYDNQLTAVNELIDDKTYDKTTKNLHFTALGTRLHVFSTSNITLNKQADVA